MKNIKLSINKNLILNHLIINDGEEFIFDNTEKSFFYYFTPLTFMPAKDNFLFLQGAIVNFFSGELFHFKSEEKEYFFNLFFDIKIGDNYIINGFVNDYTKFNCVLKRLEINHNLYENNFDLFPLQINSCSINLNNFKTHGYSSNYCSNHLKVNNLNDFLLFIEEEYIPIFKHKIELLTQKNIPLDIVYKLKNTSTEGLFYRTILKFLPDLNYYYGGTIQIDKKIEIDYHNRIINKVFQKTEFFSKSGHWYFNISSNSISISQALQKILNTANDSLNYNEFIKLFLVETNRNYFKTIFKNCISNATDFELELSYKDTEDSVKWFKIAGSADTINTNIVGVYGTISDITNEKKYALLLRESKEQFETILNHNLQGYILLNKNADIISFNEIVYKSTINFYKSKLELDSPIVECIKDINKDEFYIIFKKCLNGEIIHIENYFDTKSGKKEYFKTSYIPIYSSKNSLDRVLIIVTNITDYKVRELELKDLSIVASSIGSSVYILDKNYKIKWHNASYEKLIQLDNNVILGIKPLIFNNDFVKEKVIFEIEDAILNKKNYKAEVNIKRYNQTNYWANINVTPIFDSEQKLYQLIVIEDDITDKKNAEAYNLFLESQKKLRSTREQKIRTLSVLNGQETERMKFSKELHEGIGQSLTATKFDLEGIKKYSDNDIFLDKITTIDKSLKDVIERIREVSKDLSPSTLYDFGLEPVLEELLTKHRKETTIKFSFSSNLMKNRIGIVYEVELYRIISEILLNAIKHSNCDSILVDLSYVKKTINISIADNGIGFEKDKVKFNTKGLKTIKERARLIGATINYTSRIGMGSVFSIDLNFNKE